MRSSVEIAFLDSLLSIAFRFFLGYLCEFLECRQETYILFVNKARQATAVKTSKQVSLRIGLDLQHRKTSGLFCIIFA